MIFLTGKVLNQPKLSLVMSPGHREELKRIEMDTGCIIQSNYRNYSSLALDVLVVTAPLPLI
jgi:hypothetical protein